MKRSWVDFTWLLSNIPEMLWHVACENLTRFVIHRTSLVNFCGVKFFSGIRTEPLGLFSMLCNTLRACSKMACHHRSLICRKSTNMSPINLSGNFSRKSLQEKPLQILFAYFHNIWPVLISWDFEQIELHVFCLPQVNISDCNILLYTPRQITWMWNFSKDTNSLKTLNVYVCMGCEMSAFSNAPKCAQKTTLKMCEKHGFFMRIQTQHFVLVFFLFFFPV